MGQEGNPLRGLTTAFAAQEGMQKILNTLASGSSATIDGAWGSSSSLCCAALALPRKFPLLVVISHPADLENWKAELLAFSGTEPEVFQADDDFTGKLEVRGELSSSRLRLIKSLQTGFGPTLILSTIQALLQAVPSKEEIASQSLVLRKQSAFDPEQLTRWLVDSGYEPTEAVVVPGQFSRRGGILDLYPPDASQPIRVDFFGEEIDTIREFSAETQRSLSQVEEARVMGISRGGSEPPRGHLSDHLQPGTVVILVEPEELQDQGKHYLDRMGFVQGLYTTQGAFALLQKQPTLYLSAMPRTSGEIHLHLKVESVERFSGEASRVREELDLAAARDQLLVACSTEAEAHRLGEVLAPSRVCQEGRLRFGLGLVRHGFRLVGQDGQGSTAVLGSHALFRKEETTAPPVARRKLESRAIDSFLDLNAGDLVVHVSHGIARFLGMEILEKKKGDHETSSFQPGVKGEEHLILEFRDRVKVYVPAAKIDLVQKYVGGSRQEPELSRFGGTGWGNRKAKVQQAVMDMACEMLRLQALRETQPGFAFPSDTDWQKEFEASFPYQETPDQLTSLAEIKKDMEHPRPMDRLVCGDVGYGKTELAIRAAFKSIDHGKQVAVLVPTTVLAEQHLRTFSQRMAGYPFTMECLNRFRTHGEQRDILKRLESGAVDIVIGTHRLLSQDVKFKDLGLVIIDEEQRFGVEHKEKLKAFREKTDILTMTATPIPRTLHLSLLGIRDISNLETPPAERQAIETRIVRWDRDMIRHAILRELNREGQIYFVHNRVHDIEKVADKLRALVPEASLAIVHGQMNEHELEDGMVRFLQRRVDILVATTIIESGLDIPNANTIFIDDADIYGLADLHQLRGRVGRQQRRAYAYLLLDSGRTVSPDAARRLKAIEEYTELGAGFKIALRDLEIRGAGNILGTQQSGHIATVGYEMYCQLLENAVRQMKNVPLRAPLEVHLDFDWPAYLPRDYVSGQKPRIEVYRRLARIRKLEQLADFQTELQDRFGPAPPMTKWLIRLAQVRILASRWQVSMIHLERPGPNSTGPTHLVFTYRNAKKASALALRSKNRLRVVDGETIYCKLQKVEDQPERLYQLLMTQLRGGDKEASLVEGPTLGEEATG